MNQLSLRKRCEILHMLVEGNSLRATARIANVSRNTVNKLFCEAGLVATAYCRNKLINLNCERIECDEIWSFVYSKAKNVEKQNKHKSGDIWTWVALDPDTKLVPCWHVGKRSLMDADIFMCDLASRLNEKIQLTTDGYREYIDAVEINFAGDIDYAQLIKQYKNKSGFAYVNNLQKTSINGQPNEEFISTSYVERQNLTMRMSMRRFTRLSNGFSKKLANHKYAVALHFFYYNFVRVHKSLGVTPVMEAGVTNTLYDLDYLVNFL